MKSLWLRAGVEGEVWEDACREKWAGLVEEVQHLEAALGRGLDLAKRWAGLKLIWGPQFFLLNRDMYNLHRSRSNGVGPWAGPLETLSIWAEWKY